MSKENKTLKDIECINAYLKGDEYAFNILYNRYRKQLYSYLNKLIPGQTQLIDDIYQKTWTKAIDNFSKYKEKGTFFAWLMRIAHNSFVDYCRVEAKKDINYNPEHFILTPLKKLEFKEISKAYEEALKNINPEQREVFLLRKNEVPFKEIAEIQNSSISTVLARMRYAVTNLKEILSDFL